MADRIRALRDAKFGPRGKRAFSKAIGVHPSTYDSYETGSAPNALVLGRMIAVTGCSPDWLLYGEGEMFRRPAPAPAQAERSEAISRLEAALEELKARHEEPPRTVEMPPEWAAKFIALPLLADSAAAGNPREIDDSDIEDYVLMYARRVPHPAATSCIRVEGDSMEPVLPSGSIVGVDAAVRDLEAVIDRLAAVRDPEGEGVMVKRIRLRREERIVVFASENPEYAGVEVPAGEVEERGLVIGKVIWAWAMYQ